jgi:hypothetical protein
MQQRLWGKQNEGSPDGFKLFLQGFRTIVRPVRIVLIRYKSAGVVNERSKFTKNYPC